MANGFGYAVPGAKPPDPSQVGEMLLRPRGMPEQAQQPAQMQHAPMNPGQHHEFAPMTPEEGLRREGGKLSGGAGDDGRFEAAVGEALTRAGGGHRGNPNPHKPRGRHIQQLQQLGLSDVEAMLLGETL